MAFNRLYPNLFTNKTVFLGAPVIIPASSYPLIIRYF